MWTVAVEMSGVDVQDRAGVLFVVDQCMIGALPAYAADEAFRETVRPRRPGRDLDHLDALGGEHRVNRRNELGIPVADEEPERRRPVAEVDPQVQEIRKIDEEIARLQAEAERVKRED